MPTAEQHRLRNASGTPVRACWSRTRGAA